MDRIFTIILMTLVLRSANAQFQIEDVYVLGNNFAEKECRVEAYCQWSRLIFLTEDKFALDHYCYMTSDSMLLMDIFVGRYQVSGDTLYLFSINSAVNKVHSEWFKEESIIIPDVTLPDMHFKITWCNGGDVIVLKGPVKQYSYGTKDWYGIPTVRQLKDSGDWKKLVN